LALLYEGCAKLSKIILTAVKKAFLARFFQTTSEKKSKKNFFFV